MVRVFDTFLKSRERGGTHKKEEKKKHNYDYHYRLYETQIFDLYS